MDDEVIHEKGPQPTRAFICNLMSETVSVIDLEKQIPRNIYVGTNPVFSMVSPYDPEKLIVTLHNYNKEYNKGYLVLVDLLESSVIKKILHPGPAMPSGMVYDNRHDVLYVADENLHRIYAHDGKTLEVLSYLPAGRAPAHVDISKEGDYLVAANRMSANLHIYDLEDASNVKNGQTIRLGHASLCHPYDVKFSTNSNICYVTDFGTGELLIVDNSEHIVTDRIKVGISPFGMALNKDGDTAYVCNAGSNSISIIDLMERIVIGELTEIDGYPMHCAIDEQKCQLLVTCQGGRSEGSIQIFDLQTKMLIATIIDDMIQAPIGINFDR